MANTSDGTASNGSGGKNASDGTASWPVPATSEPNPPEHPRTEASMQVRTEALDRRDL